MREALRVPQRLHSSHYFDADAMRYHGTRGRMSRCRGFSDRDRSAGALPNCAVVAPAAGGIPVAFGIREALDADQIFWAEKEDGRYYFRQYLDARGMKCILVDDIVRSGKVLTYMVELIRQAGAEVVAVGSLVHFKDAHIDLSGVPYYWLLDVDCQFYTPETCPMCKGGEPLEKVWI